MAMCRAHGCQVTLTAMLAARTKTVNRYKALGQSKTLKPSYYIGKSRSCCRCGVLAACVLHVDAGMLQTRHSVMCDGNARQAHSSAEKDALIAGVLLRQLDVDPHDLTLHGDTLAGLLLRVN